MNRNGYVLTPTVSTPSQELLSLVQALLYERRGGGAALDALSTMVKENGRLFHHEVATIALSCLIDDLGSTMEARVTRFVNPAETAIFLLAAQKPADTYFYLVEKYLALETAASRHIRLQEDLRQGFLGSGLYSHFVELCSCSKGQLLLRMQSLFKEHPREAEIIFCCLLKRFARCRDSARKEATIIAAFKSLAPTKACWLIGSVCDELDAGYSRNHVDTAVTSIATFISSLVQGEVVYTEGRGKVRWSAPALLAGQILNVFADAQYAFIGQRGSGALAAQVLSAAPAESPSAIEALDVIIHLSKYPYVRNAAMCSLGCVAYPPDFVARVGDLVYGPNPQTDADLDVSGIFGAIYNGIGRFGQYSSSYEPLLTHVLLNWGETASQNAIRGKILEFLCERPVPALRGTLNYLKNDPNLGIAGWARKAYNAIK